MVYATEIDVTCDVCQERVITLKSNGFINLTRARLMLTRRGWSFSKGMVPFTGADGRTYYREGAQRNVCPMCKLTGRYRREGRLTDDLNQKA